MYDPEAEEERERLVERLKEVGAWDKIQKDKENMRILGWVLLTILIVGALFFATHGGTDPDGSYQEQHCPAGLSDTC